MNASQHDKWEILEISVTRADGQPDTGGNPAGLLAPGEYPEILPFLPAPQPVYFPDPIIDPGPDGQPGTSDDPEPIYPPYVLPGSVDEPTIWINPDETAAPWLNAPTEIPNLQGETDPDWDPNRNPDGSDPNPTDGNEQPLKYPGPQSSGCDGWGYAVCKLKNKFPFDFVGTLPAALPEPPCPTFTFFNQSAEFCWLRTLSEFVPWVVAIAMSCKALLDL